MRNLKKAVKGIMFSLTMIFAMVISLSPVNVFAEEKKEVIFEGFTMPKAGDPVVNKEITLVNGEEIKTEYGLTNITDAYSVAFGGVNVGETFKAGGEYSIRIQFIATPAVKLNGATITLGSLKSKITTANSDAAIDAYAVFDFSIPAVDHSISIKSNVNGSAVTDVTKAKNGALVNITATPNEGYRFDSWAVLSGKAEFADLKIAKTTFKMNDEDVVIEPVFKANPVAVQFTPDGGNINLDMNKMVENKILTEAVGIEEDTWTLIDGELPEGLTLGIDKNKVLLEGTPTKEGTYRFKLSVENKDHDTVTTKEFVVVVSEIIKNGGATTIDATSVMFYAGLIVFAGYVVFKKTRKEEM